MNKKKDILASGRQLANTAAIMRYLAHNGPVSQLQVVEDTPLKRTSIFNIFEQLDQAGLVVVNSSVPALRKGRPSQLWEVNPSAGSFLVAYLSNSEEHYNVYDFTGAVQENVSCKSAEKFDDAVLGMVDRFRDWKTKYCFRAVIVVLPGAVDSENGTVVVSRTWHVENIPLAEKIGKILEEDVPGIPVVIENNARMAAWGEKQQGSCIGLNNFITLHLNNGRCNGRRTPIGVGSGIVLNGKLYGGFGGSAGELDEACYRWFDKIYSNDRFPVSLRELDPKLRVRFATQLAESFSHLVNYLAPERLAIVFDHETALPDFIMALENTLRKQLMLRHKNSFPVGICPDGVGAIMRGAVALLREKYFDDSQGFLELLRERLGIDS